MSDKPVVYVIACCYNEAAILPFFLDHYIRHVGASKVILYDGGSTDASAEIAAAYPQAVFKVEPSDKLDDRDLLRIRNEEWKNYRHECDWIIVCDVDEFLYCEDPQTQLQSLKAEGITLPMVEGFEMYAKTFPRHEPGKFLWQEVQTGVANPQYGNKNLIFDPRIDINYGIGCHRCDPTGPVVRSEGFVFKSLHYCHLSYEAVVAKSRAAAARLSEWNESVGAGFHRKLYAAMSRTEFNRKFFDTNNVLRPFPPPVEITPTTHLLAQLLLDTEREPSVLELGSGNFAFYAWFVHTYGGHFVSLLTDAGAAAQLEAQVKASYGTPVRTTLLTGTSADLAESSGKWDLVHIDAGSVPEGADGQRRAAMETLEEFALVEPQLSEEAVVVAEMAGSPDGYGGRMRFLAYYLIGRGHQAFLSGNTVLFARRNLMEAK